VIQFGREPAAIKDLQAGGVGVTYDRTYILIVVHPGDVIMVTFGLIVTSVLWPQ
jgi:hypothetical protein